MSSLVPSLAPGLLDEVAGVIAPLVPKLPAVGSLIPKLPGAAIGKIGGAAGAIVGDLIFPAPVADGTIPEGAVPITPNTVENAPAGEALKPKTLGDSATLYNIWVSSSGTYTLSFDPNSRNLNPSTKLMGSAVKGPVSLSKIDVEYANTSTWNRRATVKATFSTGDGLKEMDVFTVGSKQVGKSHWWNWTLDYSGININWGVTPLDNSAAPTYTPAYDPNLGIPIPAGNNPVDIPQAAAPAAPFPSPFPGNIKIPNWLNLPGDIEIPENFPPIDQAPSSDPPIPIPVPGIVISPENIIIPELFQDGAQDLSPGEIIIPEIIQDTGNNNNNNDDDEVMIPIIIPIPIPIPEQENPPPNDTGNCNLDEFFGDCTPQELCEKLDNVINNTISIINNQATTRHVTIDTAIAAFHNAAILSNNLDSLSLVANSVKNNNITSIYANNGDVVDISNLSFTSNIINSLKPLPNEISWQSVSTIYTSVFNAYSHLNLTLEEHKKYLEFILSNVANINNSLKISKIILNDTLEFAGTGNKSVPFINFYKAGNLQIAEQINNDSGGDAITEPIVTLPSVNADDLSLITNNISKINEYVIATQEKIDTWVNKINDEKTELETQFNELEEEINNVEYPTYIQPELGQP